MNETRLQRKIQEAIKKEYKDGYVFKVHGGQYSQGVPDLIACIEGTFFGLEVKLPGKEKRVTELQRHNLDKINLAGGQGWVVTSVEQALEVIEDGLS